jgi:hypothetical protein
VALFEGRIVAEASGGITIATSARWRRLGVGLTDSVPILDIAFDVEPLSGQASLPKKHVTVAGE